MTSADNKNDATPAAKRRKLNYVPPPGILQSGTGITIKHSIAKLHPSLVAEQDLRNVVHRLFNGVMVLQEANQDANSFFTCLNYVNPKLSVQEIRKLTAQKLTPADVSCLRQICHSQHSQALSFMDAKAIELFTNNKDLPLNEIQRAPLQHSMYQEILCDESTYVDVVSMQCFANLSFRVSIHENSIYIF